ncbi:hypothetical protein DPMN_082916 [Dreissena polymorpha]|uniref:Methyltransferase type 11 domain-containing protein n=2 Tax=Dreissena polymorpha TaxID=45954 RepID=A0A9D3YAW7_DREPO|nr:hypothetical protein DPMN_082916 [Dreissena polymorpha]
MLKMAEGSLSQEILAKKVQLKFCSVKKLPYDPNYFDKIFHVNCYYFWPDLDMAMQELQRVIKPQGKLVTTLNLERLKEVKSKNMMQCGNFDPDRYMKALERNGFTNIKMADIKDKIAFQSITATANKN